MKKFTILLSWLVALPLLLNAQDKILYRTGVELNAKIIEITSDSVYFSAPDLTGRFAESKYDIFMITFQNGAKEVFETRAARTVTEPVQTSKTYYSPEQLYSLGQRDAKQYFKAGNAYWATLGATLGGVFVLGLLAPAGGAGTGIAIASSRPKQHNIIVSDPILKTEPAYMEGYVDQAKKKKLGNAAGGFVTGTSILTVGVLLILSGMK